MKLISNNKNTGRTGRPGANNISEEQFFANSGLMLGITGLLLAVFYMPEGMFYGFFAGVMAVVLGVLAKTSDRHVKRAVPSIIIGIITVMFSFMVYSSLLTIYAALKDPVAGPQFTQLFSELLSQYGLSIEDFSRLIQIS